MSGSISATGMAAQRTRINVIAHNLANANTTRTAEGTPYRRRTVVFEPIQDGNSFQSTMSRLMKLEGGVLVSSIVEDTSENAFIRVHDPQHPDADEDGFLLRPNINPVVEMVNLLEATRAYEANVAAYNADRQMNHKALQIGGV